ncbi:MAG TPA: hypothetical protein DCG12_11120 [Planctomycetaceae bacterium]|nr:hypothetical protein [Planctomycetaceae bacterium]
MTLAGVSPTARGIMNSQGDAFLFPEGMTSSLLEIRASTFFLTISRFNVFAFPRVIPGSGTFVHATTENC